jgi:hypothetical protein
MTAVDRKLIGHTVADLSSNELDFLCTSFIERCGYGTVL